MSKHIHVHLHARTRDADNEYEHLSDDTIVRKMLQGDKVAEKEAKRRGIDKKTKDSVEGEAFATLALANAEVAKLKEKNIEAKVTSKPDTTKEAPYPLVYIVERK